MDIQRGYFFNEKLDELLRRSWRHCIKGLSDWFGNMFFVNLCRKGGELIYDGAVYATGGRDELDRARARREAALLSYPKVVPRHVDGQDTAVRQTLQHVKINLFTFFQPIELHEPTFKEVVAIFRADGLVEDPWSPDTINPNHIVVEKYRDVPLSDLDLILPVVR